MIKELENLLLKERNTLKEQNEQFTETENKMRNMFSFTKYELSLEQQKFNEKSKQLAKIIEEKNSIAKNEKLNPKLTERNEYL